MALTIDRTNHFDSLKVLSSCITSNSVESCAVSERYGGF